MLWSDMRTALALVLLAAAVACSTDGKPRAGGACPGSQDRCVTERECTVDRERGCELCLCRPAFPPGPGDPSGARPENARDPQAPPLR